jgi:hypothetical protein
MTPKVDMNIMRVRLKLPWRWQRSYENEETAD